MSTLVARDQSGVLQAQRGETEDLRTRGCKRWLVRENADGSKTYRVGASIGPIHYREDPFDERADWHEIDLDLEAAPAAAEWDWQCLTNGYQVRVWQDGYAAEFRRAGQYVRMRPVAVAWMNAAGERQVIAKPTAGVKPTIDNEAHFIQWQDLFGKGIDFRYNLSPDKFFKTVVVRSADALPKPTIGAKGMRLVVVMALAFDGWPGNGFTGNVDCRALSAADVDDGKADEVLDEPEKHAHMRTDGREAFWVHEPRAWDSADEPAELPIRWRLERRGGDVFGLFSVLATDLKGATYPVYVDTAIAEEQVGAGADDGSFGYRDESFDKTSAWSQVGRWFNYDLEVTYIYDMWVRFLSVPIPNGATIDSAAISFKAPSDCYGTAVNALLRAQDEDTATQLTDYEGATWTTASVQWNNIETWTWDEWYNTPDIASVVAEVTSREGWVSNNALGFQCADNGSSDFGDKVRVAYQYDGGAANGAKFNCTYTAGGGSAIPAIMHHYRQLRSR